MSDEQAIRDRLCHYAKYVLDTLKEIASRQWLTSDDAKECLINMRRLNIVGELDFDGPMFASIVTLPEYAVRYAFLGEDASATQRGVSRADRRYEIIKGMDFKCPKCGRSNLYLNRQWKFPSTKRHLPKCVRCHLGTMTNARREEIITAHIKGKHFGQRPVLSIPTDWRCTRCNRQTSPNRRLWRMTIDGTTVCKSCHNKLKKAMV